MERLAHETPSAPQIIEIITRDMSVSKARVQGSMPDGWMMNYAPEQLPQDTSAAAKILGSPEWDDNVVTYAKTLYRMAEQATQALAQAQDSTPQNIGLLYAARLALLSEAYAYQNTKGRPSYPLTAFLHWREQTKTALGHGERIQCTPEQMQTIIRLRMRNVRIELNTLLSFVQNGSWQSNGEKTRFINVLRSMPANDLSEMYKLWEKHSGIAEDFDNLRTTFTQTITEYVAAFEKITIPANERAQDIHRVTDYLERIGIVESPEQIRRLCQKELQDLHVALTQLKNAHPECTQTTLPNDNAAIKKAGADAKQWYAKHFIESGIVPGYSKLQNIDITCRSKETAQNSTVFAEIDSSGTTIYLPPASASVLWESMWADVRSVFVHELTHGVQQHSQSEIPLGFLSGEAEESGAVAMEHLSHAIETSPQALYQALQCEARRIARVILSIEYHSGTLQYTDIKDRIKKLDLNVNDTTLNNMITTTLGEFSVIGKYWFGPRFIYAYAKSEHNGNLKEALQTLAQTTGLRLPAHALIKGFVPGQFSLTDGMFNRHPLAQIVEQYIKTRSSTNPN